MSIAVINIHIKALTMESVINVALYDEMNLRLCSYAKLIDSFDSIQVLFKSVNSRDLSNKIKRQKPDVLIVLACKADKEFCDFIKSIKMYNLNTIAITTTVSNWLIPNIKQIGIRGYVVMKTRTSSLVEAIESVSQGNFYCCKEVSSVLLGMRSVNQIELTQREMEIVRLLINDMSSKEIAEELCLSQHTISSHRKVILRKFNVRSTTGMVKKAIESGLA